MLRLLAVVALLTSCATAYDTWVHVDSCDTKRVPEHAYPAVGRLYTNGGYGICTATLVAADVILTAEHCISTEMSFTFDGWQRYVAVTLWRDRRVGPLHDAALLLLDRPVRGVRPATLSPHAPGRDHPLRFIGYGCFARCVIDGRVYKIGTGTKTSVEIPAETFIPAWNSSSGWYPCGGDSGGPVFDGTGIVAILVAGSRTHDWSAVMTPELRSRVSALLRGESMP